MGKSGQSKDWFFRYNRVLNVRFSDKQKDFFLNSIIKDILPVRDDLQVIEVRDGDKVVSKNLYIGNIKKAERVVSTYYDTPLFHFGPYTFFNYEMQRKQTLKFNMCMSILILIIGIIFTYFVGIPFLDQNQGFSLQLILISILYMVFVYLTGHFAKGVPRKQNLIRNNASIVAMLKMIYEIKDKKIAYAFVDTGTTNRAGLNALMERVSSKTNVYYLDSISSERELYILNAQKDISDQPDNNLTTVGNKQLNYIISAQKDGTDYFLSKEDLKSKHVNIENIAKIVENIRR